MSKALTAELIIQRTKNSNLGGIKNLNLWGNDLSDVSILQEMPLLEVLSLSVNKIGSLQDFSNCRRLTELYLRKNRVSDLHEIKYLKTLPALRVLWLWDNPCSEDPNYRLYVIKMLPQLEKLDNTLISEEEKERAFQTDIDIGESPPRSSPGQRKAAAYHGQPEEDPSYYPNYEQPPLHRSITEPPAHMRTPDKMAPAGGMPGHGEKERNLPFRGGAVQHSPKNYYKEPVYEVPDYPEPEIEKKYSPPRQKHSPPRQKHSPPRQKHSPPRQKPQTAPKEPNIKHKYKAPEQTEYPTEYMSPGYQKQGVSREERMSDLKKQSEDHRRNVRKYYDNPNKHSENCLCAVLTLLKELDTDALEIVKEDCQRKIKLNLQQN